MIKGNRRDLYGFKAAEENRSLSLKPIYSKVIHSQSKIPKQLSLTSFSFTFNGINYSKLICKISDGDYYVGKLLRQSFFFGLMVNFI